MSAFAAIAGLGMTPLGRVYGRTANQFAADAVRGAVRDAGIGLDGLDGLLVNAGATKAADLSVARMLGLRDLALAAEVQSFGSSAGVMVQMAGAAIATGLARTVACVFADDPLRAGSSASGTYAGRAPRPGLDGLPAAVGLRGAPTHYALAARRHMHVHGTTEEDLAAVAVSTRAWATLSPLAQMREPITVSEHLRSRMICDPLRLLDCCLVSNGAIAVVVTSEARARDLAPPPVLVHGAGQCHPGYPMDARNEQGLVTGARESGRRALSMAGATIDDVTAAQLYDCFTITTLLSVEDYGFCEKGQAGELFRSSATAPGGSLPINTGGGQLSGYYMWGMTPLSEAVIQVRGHGGDRQVPRNDLVLVSGNGGALDHHSTLVLGPAR